MTKDGKWIGDMGVYNYKDKESQMYSELKNEVERDLIIIYKRWKKVSLWISEF